MENELPITARYRPKTVDEVSQTESIIRLFKTVLKNKQMNHYIFFGPPGTGKTSMAMALGTQLFQEHSRDRLIKFNASVVRGIDAICNRVVPITNVLIPPKKCKSGDIAPGFKIIIMDEADCMSTEAQNALNITLEKQNSCCRFIFICNFPNKITNAIRSRCVPVKFNKIPTEIAIDRMTQISDQENLCFKREELEEIMEVCDGDMRKCLTVMQNLKSILDYREICRMPACKLINEYPNLLPKMNYLSPMEETSITELIYQAAGKASSAFIKEWIGRIWNSNDISQVISICRELADYGYSLDEFINSMCRIVCVEVDFLTDDQKVKILRRAVDSSKSVVDGSNYHTQLMPIAMDIWCCNH